MMNLRLGNLTLIAISIVLVGLLLIYIEPTFLNAEKASVKILKVGKGVQIIGKNMLCINYPEVDKLYYFATVKVLDVTTVRLVAGSGIYSLLPGKIVICNVNTGKCIAVNGMLKTLTPGVYNISAVPPVATAVFCIQFVG